MAAQSGIQHGNTAADGTKLGSSTAPSLESPAVGIQLLAATNAVHHPVYDQRQKQPTRVAPAPAPVVDTVHRSDGALLDSNQGPQEETRVDSAT